MSGWLAAAKADAPVASAPRVPEAKAGTTKVVVDANAIVKGIRLERLAEEAVTIPEVLREIKDKQARHTLATLPFELKVRDPDEASIKAVRRFARLTGDLGALSDPDVRCIALHLMLENEAHGLAHVRSEPPPLVLSKHKHNKQTKQPGWDYVPDEDAWAELDAMNAEAERSAAEVAGRMASASLAEAPEKPPPLPATALLALEMKERLEKKRQKQRETEALLGEEGLGSALSVTNGETDEKNVDDDDGGWEQNVSRTTRVRRAKRAERQREAAAATKATIGVTNSADAVAETVSVSVSEKARLRKTTPPPPRRRVWLSLKPPPTRPRRFSEATRAIPSRAIPSRAIVRMRRSKRRKPRKTKRHRLRKKTRLRLSSPPWFPPPAITRCRTCSCRWVCA